MVGEIPRPRAEPHCHHHHAPVDDCDARGRDPRHGARPDCRVGKSPGTRREGWPVLEILESADGVGFSRCRDAGGGMTLTNSPEQRSMVMVDRQKLGAWIQPQHLDDAALEQYRKSYTSHPARLVV